PLQCRIGIEAEMPEAAPLVRQSRIDGRIVQIQDRAIRVARILLRDRIRKGERDRRTVALRDVANSLIAGLLQRQQRILPIGLVVEGDKLQLRSAKYTAPSVYQIDRVLKRPHLHLADIGKRPRERVDKP